MIILIYAVCSLLFWILISGMIIKNSKKIVFLNTVSAREKFDEPSVTLIMAVKDEEQKIRQSLQSALDISYSNYKILIVNDRSTDRTAEILATCKNENPRIEIVTITDLPSGWIGKNHACYVGAMAADTEWILFTDGDVIFSKDSVKKALYYADTNGIDHLPVFPKILSPTRLLRWVMATFQIGLESRKRPWEAKDPQSKSSIGVGSFNLIKKKVYEVSGTHKKIRLRPDEDFKLGEIVKAAGFKQEVLYGDGEVEVEWYADLKGFVNGLVKNNFAFSEYKISNVITGVIRLTLIFILPVPVLLLFGNLAERICAVLIFALQLRLFVLKPALNAKAWWALFIPLSGVVMAYITIRSCYLTYKHKGIYWRDTFYPLDELIENR
jgi:glycosyltransferase involved in cell wall biosynthesis